MLIRDYRPEDEQAWVYCRVLSFLDCSYYRDVQTQKNAYAHPCVSLVAEDEGRIVGLIDLEVDSDDLMYRSKGTGAVLWHMAVLPRYRRTGVARQLWQAAEKRLQALGVCWCELWTQEDEAANRFYRAMGFELDAAHTWLRCRAEWNLARDWLNLPKAGEIYGVEEVVFQAPATRRAELEPLCTAITEVRLYTRAITANG